MVTRRFHGHFNEQRATKGGSGVESSDRTEKHNAVIFDLPRRVCYVELSAAAAWHYFLHGSYLEYDTAAEDHGDRSLHSLFISIWLQLYIHCMWSGVTTNRAGAARHRKSPATIPSRTRKDDN